MSSTDSELNLKFFN